MSAYLTYERDGAVAPLGEFPAFEGPVLRIHQHNAGDLHALTEELIFQTQTILDRSSDENELFDSIKALYYFTQLCNIHGSSTFPATIARPIIDDADVFVIDTATNLRMEPDTNADDDPFKIYFEDIIPMQGDMDFTPAFRKALRALIECCGPINAKAYQYAICDDGKYIRGFSGYGTVDESGEYTPLFTLLEDSELIDLDL